MRAWCTRRGSARPAQQNRGQRHPGVEFVLFLLVVGDGIGDGPYSRVTILGAGCSKPRWRSVVEGNVDILVVYCLSLSEDVSIPDGAVFFKKIRVIHVRSMVSWSHGKSGTVAPRCPLTRGHKSRLPLIYSARFCLELF